MHFLSTFLSITTLLATVFAQAGHLKNHTQEYYLKTKLKPHQKGKARYDGLYLEAYHTGAGLNDAVLVKNQSNAIPGFLNGTNGHSGSITYQNQVFDLGSDFAYSLIPLPTETFYATWQPVEINAGGGASAPKGGSGFFINETGLQWTSALNQKPGSPGNYFGGWLVCNWWHHNNVQLFFRLNGYNPSPVPHSCADVWLMPEYF